MNPQQQSLIEKIQKIIDASTLSADDKKLLSSRIPSAPPIIIESLIQLFEEDPSSLDLLVKNLKMKLDSLDNPGKVKEIIELERQELNRALNEI